MKSILLFVLGYKFTKHIKWNEKETLEREKSRIKTINNKGE